MAKRSMLSSEVTNLNYLRSISPSEKPVRPFDGSLNRDLPATNIGDNDSPYILNYRHTNGIIAPRPGLEVIGSAVDNIPMASVIAQWRDGTTDTLAITKTKIYRLSAGAWSELTAGAGATLTGTDLDPFSAAVWPESDRICFSQGTDVVQYFQKGGTTYEVLNASCPAAKILTVFARRLNLFLTSESADIKGQRHRYSVSGNITDWTGVGSGYRDLSDNEESIINVRRLLGAMYVYKSRSITRISSTGSALTPFQYDQSWSTGRGLVARRSLVSRGHGHYGLFNDGVFQYTGSQFLPVGNVRVDTAILNSFYTSSANLVVGAYLYDLGEYWLGVPIGTSTYCNSIWVYSEKYDRWSYLKFNQDVSSVGECAVDSALTIDQLSGTIDAQLYPIDYPEGLSTIAPMMFGLANKTIVKFNELTGTDAGVVIPLEWQSKDFKSDKPAKMISICGLGVEYQDWGAVTLDVDVSINGGVSWTSPQTVTFGGNADGSTRVKWCWFEVVGQRVRFRVYCNTSGQKPKIVGFYPLVADGGDLV